MLEDRINKNREEVEEHDNIRSLRAAQVHLRHIQMLVRRNVACKMNAPSDWNPIQQDLSVVWERIGTHEAKKWGSEGRP